VRVLFDTEGLDVVEDVELCDVDEEEEDDVDCTDDVDEEEDEETLDNADEETLELDEATDDELEVVELEWAASEAAPTATAAIMIITTTTITATVLEIASLLLSCIQIYRESITMRVLNKSPKFQFRPLKFGIHKSTVGRN